MTALPEGLRLGMGTPAPAARDVLVVCDGAGWLLLPPERVAVLREEGTGRVEVTASDGRVAHRPGTLEGVGAPWVPVEGGAWVHPRLVRRVKREVLCPGGWRFAVAGPLPGAGAKAPEEEVIPQIGVRRSEVLALVTTPRGRGSTGVKGAVWLTDRGRVPVMGTRVSGAMAAGWHGGLVRVGSWYVNLRRVRDVRNQKLGGRNRLVLTLDDGTTLRLNEPRRRDLCQALGMEAFDRFQKIAPQHEGLYRYGLRDYPVELADAAEAVLRHEFGDDTRRLVANVVWQACRYRRKGRTVWYGTDHRGFYYHPLLPVLARAGLLPAEPTEREALYAFYERIVAEMVGEHRLIRYEDLGFGDPRPDLRRIGIRHPGLTVVVEKATVCEMAFALAEQFGVTLLILGGAPELIVTEHFVKTLRAAYGGALQVVAYVDYDPEGWIIGRAFCDQLRLYGVEAGEPAFLVTPDRFTAAERARIAVPLRARNQARRTINDAWMRETGGVDGQPLAIHCDHLRPLTRVAEALQALMRRLLVSQDR